MSRVGLRADRRRPGSVVIMIDGARFASLPDKRVAELGLRQGIEIRDATLARVEAAVDAENAYQRAVRLLASRPRASYEMLRRLRAAGHNPSAAAEAVGRLAVRGLLDDAAFARHFARTRSARGHGPGRLLRDLLMRGVDRRMAEVAIAEVQEAEGTDPRVQAEQLAVKRSAQLGRLAPEVKLRRIVGFLARRGFAGAEVVAMVRRVVSRGI